MNLFIYTVLILPLFLGSQVQLQCPSEFNEDGGFSYIENENGTSNSTNSTTNSTDEAPPTPPPRLVCSYAVKKVINKYLDWNKHYVKPNALSSPCVRCSLCLAVAKEIDVTFSETLEESHETSGAEGIKKLQENLEELCSKGFRGYAMRIKDDDLHSLSCDSACNKFVRSALDGQWDKKLREICTSYASYMDIPYLFHEYLNNTAEVKYNMTNYLCRNGGIFRDCYGVDYEPAQEEEPKEDSTLFGFF